LDGTLFITQSKKLTIIWFGGLQPNNCSFWVETKKKYFELVLCGCCPHTKSLFKRGFNLTFKWGLNVKAFYCAIFLSFRIWKIWFQCSTYTTFTTSQNWRKNLVACKHATLNLTKKKRLITWNWPMLIKIKIIYTPHNWKLALTNQN